MFVPSTLRGIKASSAVYVLIATISASLSVGHAAEQCLSDAVKAGGCKELGSDCPEIIQKDPSHAQGNSASTGFKDGAACGLKPMVVGGQTLKLPCGTLNAVKCPENSGGGL
jgi:hypothetical protein